MDIDEAMLFVCLAAIAAAAVGGGVGYFLRRHFAEARIGSAEEKAQEIVNDAKNVNFIAGRIAALSQGTASQKGQQGKPAFNRKKILYRASRGRKTILSL